MTLVAWNAEPPDRPALVAFAWAGAGAAPFRPWAPLCAGRVALYGVRPAGRESRIAEPPPSEVAAVVAEVAAAARLLGHRRIAVFGHCSGALAAFELARALQGPGGGELLCLCVASQHAPRIAAAPATPDVAAQRQRVVDAVIEQFSAEPELLEMVLPAVEADLGAAERYRYLPAGRIAAPVFVYHGRADQDLRVADLAGWNDETQSGALITTVDGADHLFSGRSWLRLGEEIVDAIEGVEAAAEG